MLKRSLTLLSLSLLYTLINAQSQWIDATDMYIINPHFDGNDVRTGWEGSPFETANPKENAEFYNKNFNAYQVINGIPAGRYVLSLKAFYRMGSSNNDYNLYTSGDYSDYQYAELYAVSSLGEYVRKIEPASSGRSTTSLGGDASTVGNWGGWGGTIYFIPNNMEAAYYWFNAGYYDNSVSIEVGDDQTLTIGIRKSQTISGDWTCLDDWKIQYWGEPTYVSSINLSESTIEMSLGESLQLTYTIEPSNTTYPKVTWSSSDESVVKVDNAGNLTALGTGNATIIVTSTDGKNKTAECEVTVVQNGGTSESLIINEIMTANTDMFIDPSWNYGGWIELYNPTDKAAGIGNYYISDDPQNLTKCRIKTEVGAIPAHGYKVLWFDHIETVKDIKVGYVNTQIGFKLNADGGTIYISDENGNLIASQEYPKSMMRIAYARTTDGSNSWGLTYTPTPGSSNAGSYFASERLDDPVVDKSGQLFEGSLQICVNIPEGAILRYTTDGTTPTLENGETSETGLFTVTNTTCYRFRLYKEGYLPSNVATRSYIMKDRDYYLPIVSVVTDPKNLYDDEIGVYVSGKNGKTANQDYTPRNFNMDWDRPVNFEYILINDGSVLNQMVNYSISGGWSRKYEPRSFKLKSAKEYDINEIPYPFFSDKPFTKQKAVMMRNGGNDEYNQTRLKDAALQEIARQSEFPLNLQSYAPAHVFYNGNYIAMLNMRETSNKQYAYANYGYDTDEVDAFEICVDSGYVQKEGDREAFERWYALSADAADASTYEEIRQVVDIDDFINYMAFKFFLNDWDWPHNNFKGFRSRNDGKFHFVVFDLDNCIDRNGNNIFNDFENKQIHTFYSRPEYGGTSLTLEVEIVTIFLNMLENEEFKKQFIDTYCIVGGCVFRDETEIEDIVNNMASNIETALSWERHSPWGNGRSFAQGIINGVTGNFKTTMTNVIRNYSRFGLRNTEAQAVNMNSNVDNAGLMINGLEVPKGKFDGYLFAPVTLKALAPAGYKFAGWVVNGTTSSESVTLFDKQSEWKYYDQGSLEEEAWYSEDYSEEGWQTGNGGFGYGREGRPMSLASTILDKGPDASNVRPTCYLRKEFVLDDAPGSEDEFVINYEVDDGMIVYINGEEAGLYHLQSGASYSNYTEDFNGSWYELDDPYQSTLKIDRSMLHKGKNVIAVEVHNCIKTSSDLWWDCSLVQTKVSNNTSDSFYSTDEEIELPEGSTLNITACYDEMSAEEKSALNIHALCINEVSASNSIYINDHGKKNDWVEIYNTTDEDIDIEGWYLSDNENKATKYQISKEGTDANTIVPAHGFLIIWCDKLEPINQLHATFKLAAEGGVVMLTPPDESWNDIVRYEAHNGDVSVGRYPNGCDSVYVMNIPTIQKSNIYTTYAESVSQEKQEEPSGINNTIVNSNNGLKIYYANNAVVVRSEESEFADLSIYTMSGQEVANTRLRMSDGRSEFHLSMLPTGTYIGRAKDVDGNVCSVKFMYK